MLTGKPIGKRHLGIPRRRWEDNIRMDLKRNRYHYEEMGWFGSGQGLFESPFECGTEPSGSISYGVSGQGYTKPKP